MDDHRAIYHFISIHGACQRAQKMVHAIRQRGDESGGLQCVHLDFQCPEHMECVR